MAQRGLRFGFHGTDCISFLPARHQMGPFDRLYLLHHSNDHRILRAACRNHSGLYLVHTKPFSNKLVGYTVGALAVTFIRFLCSFLSGVLIWGSSAPEGQPVWLYSLTYNGGYMIPNMILTAVIILVLCVAIDPKTLRRPQKESANA